MIIINTTEMMGILTCASMKSSHMECINLGKWSTKDCTGLNLMSRCSWSKMSKLRCVGQRYYKHINSGHHILALNICNSSYKLVPHALQNSYQLTIYSSCQSIPRKSIAHPKMVQDTSVRNTNCIYEIIL